MNTAADSLKDLFASHPDPTARIASLEEMMIECGLDPDCKNYYLGRRNRLELISRNEKEFQEEWIQRRLETRGK